MNGRHVRSNQLGHEEHTIAAYIIHKLLIYLIGCLYISLEFQELYGGFNELLSVVDFNFEFYVLNSFHYLRESWCIVGTVWIYAAVLHKWKEIADLVGIS